MRAYQRLLNYVSYETTSSEKTGTTPSTGSQFALAKALCEELKAMGISNAVCDEKCYVYASIPATSGYESKPAIGFIAHVDTSCDFSGANVRPQIIKNYDGKDIVLGTSGRTIAVADFPHLAGLKGRTLITTDGTTLLGADDKAGVAEIMTMAEEVLASDKPHGKICLAFTPDEEIGAGADFFDIPKFGADYAYTIDGDLEGAIEYECFNAAEAFLTFSGFNIHPGEAKDRMVNAALLAMDFDHRLPKGETPRDTSGYEGFFHLIETSGTVEKAESVYIIRDHDAKKFEARVETMKRIVEEMNQSLSKGKVEIRIKNQYRNMAEIIRDHMELIDAAKDAARKAGVEPQVHPIRGGTDGASLSYRGLPCPNLGTGGSAFHGPYEHVSVEGMDTVVAILKNLVAFFAE